MNKSSKIIIGIIIVIIIAIIAIIIALQILKTNSNTLNNSISSNNTQSEYNKQDSQSKQNMDIKRLADKNLFFNINYNINNYYKYIQERNINAVKSILNGTEAKIARQYTNLDFKAQEIYVINKANSQTAFVFGVIRQNQIQDDYYLIINIDNKNSTFEIINSSKEEFENAKQNNVQNKYKQENLVEKNEYNTFKEQNISQMNVVEYYFDDYRYKAIYSKEEAFNLIESEYKEEKFSNNIDKYKEYIEKNREDLENANIVKYYINTNNQNIEYIGIDNFNNYYKFIETNINEYKIILDNYTQETEEFLNEYNKLSDKEKAISVLDKIFKLINDKDYETLYSHLNNNFKNNYFATQSSFEKYIKEKFFDNNILGNIDIKNEGEIFIITATYKESLSSAAEENTMVFNIKLKEAADFEMSLNLN